MTISVRVWDRVISAIFVFLLGAAFWPAGYWFQVDHVLVRNSHAGAPILMDVDRTIRRDFNANWDVLVRKRVGSDNWEIVCSAQGSSDYFPGVITPDPTTLEWWTGDKCSTLPEGVYRIHTTWQLEPEYSPTKRVTAVSNIFEVTP